MKLHCPDCGSAIAADDLDLSTGFAKCRGCNGAFSFREALETDRQRRETNVSTQDAVPRPGKVQIEEWGGTWKARWRWFRWEVLGLLLFCVAWDSFLVFWYTMAFTKNGPWLMVVFPLVHVAVGVGLTYSVLTGLLNWTTLELTHHALSIRHFPLPWLGNRTIGAMEIEQLYCEEGRRYNRGGTTFNLSAMLRGGRKVKLLRGFDEPDIPLFLESELERRMGIAPRRVVGEYR